MAVRHAKTLHQWGGPFWVSVKNKLKHSAENCRKRLTILLGRRNMWNFDEMVLIYWMFVKGQDGSMLPWVNAEKPVIFIASVHKCPVAVLHNELMQRNSLLFQFISGIMAVCHHELMERNSLSIFSVRKCHKTVCYYELMQRNPFSIITFSLEYDIVLICWEIEGKGNNSGYIST